MESCCGGRGGPCEGGLEAGGGRELALALAWPWHGVGRFMAFLDKRWIASLPCSCGGGGGGGVCEHGGRSGHPAVLGLQTSRHCEWEGVLHGQGCALDLQYGTTGMVHVRDVGGTGPITVQYRFPHIRATCIWCCGRACRVSTHPLRLVYMIVS